MMTQRLRLVRPVNDGRGENLWLADHLALASRVEVTFAEANASDAATARDELMARARAFHDRGEAAARINDPHVVRLLEQGDVNGVPFVVTKLLEGKSLRRRLMLGPASLSEVQQVVRIVTSVLGKAHSLGIAHGHLRPDCLFSTEQLSAEQRSEAFIEIAGFGGVEATSPANPYASPEQLLHGTANDVRSDLWALAVTAYELLTTTLPFEAATPAGVTVAICNAEFAKPSLYRADLPPGIDGWFEAALAKDPTRRFRDAAELANAFEQALSVPEHGLSVPEHGLDVPEHGLGVPEHGLGVPAEPSIPPPLPEDSLAPDDEDDDDDEKTVKWDMPEDARAIARSSSLPRGSIPPGSLSGSSVSGGSVSNSLIPSSPFSGGSIAGSPRLSSGPSAPSRPAPNLAMVSKPGSVSAPPRPLSSPPLSRPPLAPTLPPALEPGVYLESPYIASVMSALAVSSAPAAAEGAPVPVRQRLFGFDGPLFTPDKTWLAALAFAAGVAVTWFAYEPEPEGEPVASATRDGELRTLSVDDLPRVEGDDSENLRIIQTSQLPRASDDIEVAVPTRSPVASERRQAPAAAPAQRVQALAPAAPKATAVAAPARTTKSADAASNCNPPYYFDDAGIRRLKPECLNGTGVIQGPYGAVMTTNVSAKSTPAGKSANEKQARAGAGCTPPYYFDGKIRRLKLECL